MTPVVQQCEFTGCSAETTRAALKRRRAEPAERRARRTTVCGAERRSAAQNDGASPRPRTARDAAASRAAIRDPTTGLKAPRQPEPAASPEPEPGASSG